MTDERRVLNKVRLQILHDSRLRLGTKPWRHMHFDQGTKSVGRAALPACLAVQGQAEGHAGPRPAPAYPREASLAHNPPPLHTHMASQTSHDSLLMPCDNMCVLAPWAQHTNYLNTLLKWAEGLGAVHVVHVRNVCSLSCSSCNSRTGRFVGTAVVRVSRASWTCLQIPSWAYDTGQRPERVLIRQGV